eukprot:Clim_evm132s149 gene=Clim_evmTU132s149
MADDPESGWVDEDNDLACVSAAFLSYEKFALKRVELYERNVSRLQLKGVDAELLGPLLESKIVELKKCISVNQHFLSRVVSAVGFPKPKAEHFEAIGQFEFSKISSALLHVARDWSSEGRLERRQSYGWILTELNRIYPSRDDRDGIEVLVPGCGAGRLVFELARAGYHTQGNEYTAVMLAISDFMLNHAGTWKPSKPEAVNEGAEGEQILATSTISPGNPDISEEPSDDQTQQSPLAKARYPNRPAVGGDGAQARNHNWSLHAVHPWVLSFNNISALDDQTYRVMVPDRCPSNHVGPVRSQSLDESAMDEENQPNDDDTASSRTGGGRGSLTNNTAPMSMCCGEFVQSYGPTNLMAGSQFDVIATCFFIDTARNFTTYLDTIEHLLRDGGRWINIGPLLWHFSDMPNEETVEFTWKEIFLIMRSRGFTVQRFSQVDCIYTAAPRRGMTQLYHCMAFVAEYSPDGQVDLSP